MVMGTRPTMTNGWVLREGKKVQHARAVVCPAAAGEKAVMELYDATTRRITGKHPLQGGLNSSSTSAAR
jgi:hypothetical protein